MKILHYIPVFSITTETFIYDFLNNYVKYFPDDKIQILCHTRVNRKSRPFPRKCILLVNKFPRFYIRLILNFLRISLKQRTLKRINKFKADLIHIHFANNALQFCTDYSFNDIPVVISVHGSDILSMRFENQQKLVSLASLKNLHFVVNSSFLKHKLEELKFPKQQISVLPNSINETFINLRRSSPDNKKIKILTVGRLVPVKGYSLLFHALALLNNFNWELTMIGDGTLKYDLEQLAIALKINRRVNFYGEMPHQKLPTLYRSHNVYVQPSIIDTETGQVETFGLAALEGVAAGLTTVITNVGGLKELKSHFPSSVYLADPTPSSLADTLALAFEKPVTVGPDRVQLNKFLPKNQISLIRQKYGQLIQGS